MPESLQEFLLLSFKLARGIVEFISMDIIINVSNPERHVDPSAPDA